MSRQKVQGYAWLPTEFEPSLGYMRSCFKKTKPQMEFKPLVRNHSERDPCTICVAITKLFCSLPTSLGFVFWATLWLTAKEILVCLPSLQTTEVCMLSVCRRPSMAAAFLSTGTHVHLKSPHDRQYQQLTTSEPGSWTLAHSSLEAWGNGTWPTSQQWHLEH